MFVNKLLNLKFIENKFAITKTSIIKYKNVFDDRSLFTV